MENDSPKSNSLLTETKRWLRQSGLHARKRLGQHFLVNGSILNAIVTAADLSPSDVVMEVGPGLGVLTVELVKRAGYVLSVELDDSLAALLTERFAGQNLSVVNNDILKTDQRQLLETESRNFPQSVSNPFEYKVVANLPYYITAPILRHFLESDCRPERMIVMVQREVAKTITAQPGEMGILSVAVQFYGIARVVKKVPARNFYPPPEVDSAVVQITPYQTSPWPVTDEQSFFRLVRAGFSTPRKQLANSLSTGLDWPKQNVLQLLNSAGISPQRRAETLAIDEWSILWQRFREADSYGDDSGAGQNQPDARGARQTK